ncbi:MAG TPA: hypothetical protein VFZ11_10270 [Gemmatimonadaceae bacterium]
MQQPAAQTTTPAPPAPPGPPTPVSVVVGGGQATTISGLPIPVTREEVAALRARRGELSSQLISATNRRDELAEQMLESVGAAREGIEQRIRLLDQRILQLEADIAETGQQLTASGAALTTSSRQADVPFGEFSSGQLTGISIVFILFVLAPIIVTLGLRMLRRPSAPPHIPALDVMASRMERLEHAMDAVAVEVERISEGQRFVTRLLGEGQRPAEPVRIAEGAAQRVKRD